eukprot:2272554-Pleurochrysis_carterae.AAC.2
MYTVSDLSVGCSSAIPAGRRIPVRWLKRLASSMAASESSPASRKGVELSMAVLTFSPAPLED